MFMNYEKAYRVMDEVKKVIKGKDPVIEKIMMAILAGGHVLLEDIPGVGKTSLALSFSKAMGLDFNRIQFTPDVVASDIVGFSKYDQKEDEFVYEPGVVMCNLLLADEINRTSSRTQAALLEVMEEKNVTVDGKTYTLPKPFHVIATQNPIGSYGTQALPQSQLDRFMLKTSLGYPDFESQVELLNDRQKEHPLEKVEPVMTREELLSLQTEVQAIYIDEKILRYITELTEATRNHPSVLQGISPRGAIALSHIVKAKAFLDKRDYVNADDVRSLFVDTCSHRMVLHAKINDEQVEELLQSILESTKSPEVEELKV